MAGEVTVYEYDAIDTDSKLPIEPANARTVIDWGASHSLATGTRYVVVKANSASYVRITAAGTAPTSADYALAAKEDRLFPIVRNKGGNGLKVHAITQ